MHNAVSSLVKWAELILISAGLAAGIGAYRIFFPYNYQLLTTTELALGFVVSLLAFWVTLRLSEVSSRVSPLLFLRQLCAGTGLSMVLQALLNYSQLLTRSFFLILVGGLFAALLLAIARPWLYRRTEDTPASLVMVGFDPIAGRLASLLGEPIIGVIGAPTSGVPPEMPILGDLDQFEEIIAQRRPTHILVVAQDWERNVSPSVLLDLRFRGVQLFQVSALYERLLERIYCRGLYPAEMLLSPLLCVDSRTMAIQAVYTNLIGLFLLVILSPLLAVVALAVLLFSGPGPVLETIQCSGFQKIPFYMLRFRTLRTDGTGTISGVGRIISRLGLVHLPLLINIVRGEMALIGPRPVRLEFTQRLLELMPFYSIRYFVKPGILGYLRAQIQSASGPTSDLEEIESDLYYIKQASPGLDLEILIRTVLGERPRELPQAEFSGHAL